MFLMTGLFIWSTVRANQTTDPYASSGKYRPTIKYFDSLMSKVIGQTPIKSTAPIFDLFSQVYKYINFNGVQRLPITWSIGKMVANPIPMPLTMVWTNPSELKLSFRYGSFLCFAGEERIASLYKSLMPYHPESVTKELARSVIVSRSSVIKSVITGVAGGASVSFVATSMLPLSSTVMGVTTLLNGILLTNSFSTILGSTIRKVGESAPLISKTVSNQVDLFHKNEFPLMMKKFAFKSFKGSFLLATLFGGGKYLKNLKKDKSD